MTKRTHSEVWEYSNLKTLTTINLLVTIFVSVQNLSKFVGFIISQFVWAMIATKISVVDAHHRCVDLNHPKLSQKLEEMQIFSVFDYFLTAVAMATTENSQTTYEWTSTVESLYLVPHLPWSDTDLIKWIILSHIVDKRRICGIAIFKGL